MVKKIFWPLFALMTLLLRALAQAYPAVTEQWYSRGLFQGIRWCFDVLLGWLPFPLSYFLFALVLWTLGRGIGRLFFQKNISFKKRAWRAGSGLFAFLCGVIGLFYWLWGYNYNRVPIETQLSLPAVHPTAQDIAAALEAQTALVLSLRPTLQADSSRAIDGPLPRDMENMVRTEVAQCLQTLGFPASGGVRGRQPFWNGFLLRFGALGVYNPFSGECNIDPALYFLTKPYNLAHEFCHGYGFGDEGTCNFLAYIALARSQQPLLRYSAELDYWRTLAGTYRRLTPETYAKFRKTLPGGFRADLELIYKNLEQYPEFFEAFRYRLYDQYLKAQGMAEGMQNYNKIIPLVMAYRIKEKG